MKWKATVTVWPTYLDRSTLLRVHLTGEGVDPVQAWATTAPSMRISAQS